MEVPEVNRLKSPEKESAKLQKREATEVICKAMDLSQRCACRLAGPSLSIRHYSAQCPAADTQLSGGIT